MSQLQSIVDALSSRVQRPVLVDDQHGRLICHSAQPADVDPVRRATILSRDSPPEAEAWVKSFPIESATSPVRIPPNESLGMAARICMPIRSHDLLLGYLWLIDATAPLPDDDLSSVEDAATQAGDVLYRERLQTQFERARERELLRDLLSDDATIRAQGAVAVVEEELFVGDARAALLVICPRPPAALDEDEREAMAGALQDVRHMLPPRHSLRLLRPDHAALAVAARVDAPSPLEIATRIEQMLGDVYVGVGDARAIDDLAASYRQALQAVRLAEVFTTFGPVVDFAGLGVYRILANIPVERLVGDDLHAGIGRLLRHPAGARLLQTLECYLDCGCDVRAAAAKLHLQRGSMYHRLERIESVAEVDLRRGDDRLAMHLGIKLARLAGLLPVD